ncbi:MAG: selenium-dependent xanthine dehydrogenase [Lachnospirales bacterium]
MVKFRVNNKEITVSENLDRKLMNYLRDELKLTSVKDGCSEGACGTCTIVLNEKATKSCLFALSKLDGAEIFTVEGLTEREKEVYEYAFAHVGAVQCGFCTPGMVMSAKALLAKNPNPTVKDVKKAINGNICRCTGYQKIEQAIMLASEFFRENKAIPNVNYDTTFGGLNKRIDAKDKTLGTGLYADDLYLEGMIYGKALRTPSPRAKINKIDIEKAKAHPDCVEIVKKEDIPGAKDIGHLKKDWSVLIGEGEISRYIGDAICLVAATNYNSLKEIMDLIEVDYEVLPTMNNPREAMAEGAPLIHESGNVLQVEELSRGNAKEALAASKHVVTRTYTMPFTEHAFLEPECAVALPHPTIEGGVFVHTGGQGIYDELKEISEMLGLPVEKLEIESKLVGGGFGGKEDMSVQHHAALLAYLTQKPVKVKLTRQESINIHPKRHAMEIELTTGCDEEGNLTAMDAIILSDTGAYASLGGPVLQRACTHAAGPYNYQNAHIKGTAVYTNNPPAGAFRGFGVCQSAFATEMNINLLAEMVGLSPFEIRYKNAIRPGQILPNGQIADDSTALVETLDAVKEAYENNKYAGIACAFKNSGLGVGIPDTGRCIVSIENGKIHIRTSAADIGQGVATVAKQFVLETLGMGQLDVVVECPNTKRTPNAGTTTASRQTVLTGEATRRAAQMLKDELDKGKTFADLEGKEFLGEYTTTTDPITSTKENPVSHVAYGYATQVVILNDEGKVEKVVAAHDVGQLINRTSTCGQIDGGVVMGLGYALTEDYPLENGVPKVKYGTLGLLRATQAPEIESIIVDRKDKNDVAYGSKGIGEISTIPTAPAAAHAYYRFDGKFRTDLPLKETKYKK